jgi:hypothetical protein
LASTAKRRIYLHNHNHKQSSIGASNSKLASTAKGTELFASMQLFASDAAGEHESANASTNEHGSSLISLVRTTHGPDAKPGT